MLAAVFAGAPPVAAQESTANVEVRVWQKISDWRSIYVSARPEGGDWGTLGTIPLPLDDGYSSSGNYRYGDITVEGVEVRVWQEVSDSGRIYISARPRAVTGARSGRSPSHSTTATAPAGTTATATSPSPSPTCPRDVSVGIVHGRAAVGLLGC